MGEQAKLLGMTALLTVLVWVAADQFLTENATLQVKLAPVTLGTPAQVRPADGNPDTVRVSVSGPRRIIASLRELDPLPVNLQVSGGTTGVVQVRIISALEQRSGPLAGLNVHSTAPEYIRLVVDRETTLTVPIVVEGGGLDYAVAPSVEPDHVQVTVSELALARIPEERRRLVLRVENHLRNKPSGVLLDFEVPLEAKLDGVEARVQPSQVRLRATVQEQRTRATIPAVPVRFEGSADLLNEFRIELRDPSTILTQSLTVRGPSDVIAKLVSGEIKLAGVISLSRGDSVDTSAFRFEKPVFRLPPGVELADPDEVAGVEFRLVRHRSATGP